MPNVQILTIVSVRERKLGCGCDDDLEARVDDEGTWSYSRTVEQAQTHC